MANNIKRIIKENGVVIEKIFKEATDEFLSSDGRKIAAQPDRYLLKCVSGEDFNKDIGFVGSTVQEYKVPKDVFDNSHYLSPVEVKYEVSNYGTKPVSATLIS